MRLPLGVLYKINIIKMKLLRVRRIRTDFLLHDPFTRYKPETYKGVAGCEVMISKHGDGAFPRRFTLKKIMDGSVTGYKDYTNRY